MSTKFVNQFTGEDLSLYPTAFAAFAKEQKINNKQESQWTKVEKRNKCPFCGEVREWIEDTNLMVCKNPKCRGRILKDKNNDIIAILPSFSYLGGYNERLAEKIHKNKTLTKN